MGAIVACWTAGAAPSGGPFPASDRSIGQMPITCSNKTLKSLCPPVIGGRRRPRARTPRRGEGDALFREWPTIVGQSSAIVGIFRGAGRHGHVGPARVRPPRQPVRDLCARAPCTHRCPDRRAVCGPQAMSRRGRTGNGRAATGGLPWLAAQARSTLFPSPSAAEMRKLTVGLTKAVRARLDAPVRVREWRAIRCSTRRRSPRKRERRRPRKQGAREVA